MLAKRVRPAEDSSSNDSSIENSSDDEEDDEDESSGPEEVAPRLLPARTTRGKRISTLVGEAAEADAQFWGQRAFEETLSDEEFTTESEGARCCVAGLAARC